MSHKSVWPGDEKLQIHGGHTVVTYGFTHTSLIVYMLHSSLPLGCKSQLWCIPTFLPQPLSLYVLHPSPPPPLRFLPSYTC